MRIYIGHSKQWDYERELYEPILQSDLAKDNEIIFPHMNKKEFNTDLTIANSDLFIAEVSRPSLGLGIEIGRAESIGKKILCMYQKEYECPNCLKYVKVDIVEYKNKDDMIGKIERYISDKNKEND